MYTLSILIITTYMGVNELKLYNANNLNKNKNITTFMDVNELNGELNVKKW